MAGEGEPRKVSTCLVRVVPRRSTASQLPQMFFMDQKRSCGKRSEWAPNDEDNEYLCMPRWDKFHGVRSGRNRLRRRTTRRETRSGERALPSRCFRRVAEIIVRSSSLWFLHSSFAFFLAIDRRTLRQIWFYFPGYCGLGAYPLEHLEAVGKILSAILI